MKVSSIFGYLALLLWIAPFVFKRLSKKAFILTGFACIAVGVYVGGVDELCADYAGGENRCRGLLGRPARSDATAKTVGGASPIQVAPAQTGSSHSNNAGKIEGTRWSSKEMTRKGRRVPAGAIELAFSENDRMSMKIGSDPYRGTYSVGAGDAVTFNLERALADGNKTQIANIVIAGSELTMLDSDGTVGTFVRVGPITPAPATPGLRPASLEAAPVARQQQAQGGTRKSNRTSDVSHCLKLATNEAVARCVKEGS